MWKRDLSTAPDEIRLVVVISRKKHPELANWVMSLPFRKASGVVRDVLTKAISSSATLPVGDGLPGRAAVNSPQPAPMAVATHAMQPIQPHPPQQDQVTPEVAQVMSSFREMF